MRTKSSRPAGAIIGVLLAALCGVHAARADTWDAASRLRSGSGAMVLAQVTQAQSACASVCGKRCDTDNKACTMNGKAPQLLINQTCSPRYSECTSKCTASCYK
jgi:hypothetical protein